MGYSYAAKAGYTMDSIGKLLDDKYGRQCSNGMPDGGFYDYGREQRDGAMTGTVWAPWDKDPTRVVKRGSSESSRMAGLSDSLDCRVNCCSRLNTWAPRYMRPTMALGASAPRPCCLSWNPVKCSAIFHIHGWSQSRGNGRVKSVLCSQSCHTRTMNRWWMFRGILD